MKKIISYNLLMSLGQSLTNVLIIFSFGYFFLKESKSDAIFLSMTFPNFILLVWTSAIVNQVTPFLISNKLRGFDMYVIFGLLFKRLVLIILGILIICLFSKHLIVSYLNNGNVVLAGVSISHMLDITIFYIPLQLLSVTLSSYYITIEKNLFATTCFMLGNLFTIVIIILNRNSLSTFDLAYCILFGYILTAILFLTKYLFFETHRNFLKIESLSFKKIYIDGLVLMAITFFTKSIAMYYSSYTAHLEGGNVSFYNYYQYGNSFLIAIAITPFLNLFYSNHSIKIEQDQNEIFIFYVKLGKFIFQTFVYILSVSLLTYSVIAHLIENYFASLVFSKTLFILILLSSLLLILSALLGRILYLKKSVVIANLSDLIATAIFIAALYIFLPKYHLSSLVLSFFILCLINCIVPILLLRYYFGFNFFILFDGKILRDRSVFFWLAVLFSIFLSFFDINKLVLVLVILLTSFLYYNSLKRFVNNIQ